MPRSAHARLRARPPSLPAACRPGDVTGSGPSHWSISIVAGYLNCMNSRRSGGLLAWSRGVPAFHARRCLRLSQPPRFSAIRGGRAGPGCGGRLRPERPSARPSARCLAPRAHPAESSGAVMLGTSAAREAGSAPLTSQQTAPQEDQENINPEKASPAQQPRTRARLAVLKAGNQRGPAPPPRPKTRRVKR